MFEHLEKELTVCTRGQTFSIPIQRILTKPYSRLAEIIQDAGEESAAEDTNLYFDRSPGLFALIHAYYLDCHLHIPEGTCIKAVTDEMAFWKLDTDELPDCCFHIFQRGQETAAIMEDVSVLFIHKTIVDLETWWDEVSSSNSRRRRWCKAVYMFINYPRSSTAAKVTYIILLTY